MRTMESCVRLGLTLALLGSGLLGGPGKAQNAPRHVPGRILVQFQPAVNADKVRNIIAAAHANDAGEIPHSGVHIINLPSSADEKAIANAFRQKAEVVFSELDELRKPDSVPNDPGYGNQWHLPKISAPTAWDKSTGSSAVTVAILDTGVDGTHPDLSPKMVPGWNFYDNNSNTSDVYGHGTAVAGTAAGYGNNGQGAASVAWNCMIMPIRISDVNGYATYSAAANGLTWAADHGARVANISYQMTASSTISSAAQYFMSKGGVVTISAGNYSTVHTNPDNPYVLTVDATDSNDALASWSDSGSDIDVAAPGVSIYTTCNGGGYGYWSGTSFSAPIVAGVAALVISANPGLTGQQVMNAIKSSADDLGAVGWDPTYGAGRVNASNAVAAALGNGAPDTTAPVVAFANPAGGATVYGSLTVQVNATDNVGVANVVFSVDNVAVSSTVNAPYSFAWNTQGVANGVHTLTATATDAAGNQAVTSIVVTVSNVTDTTAPTVTITSPTGGKLGNSLTVCATASDAVGVVRVELWADGKLVQTDTSAPWSFSQNTRRWASGSHWLQCKAYDAAGNVGLSQIVTLTK